MPTTKTQAVKENDTEQKPQSVTPFKVTINRIVDFENSHVKAYASLSIGGSFAVHGLKVVSGKNGDFVDMPKPKLRDGKFGDDIFHAISAEARTQMQEAVLQAYEQKLAEQQEQSDEQTEQEEQGEKADLSENAGMKME